MKLLWITLFSFFLTAPALTSADTLLVDSVHQAPPNSASGVMRATRGMSMAQVEQKFGAPSEKLGPVGEPPITRWVYSNNTVYFEHNLVLTSVVKR